MERLVNNGFSKSDSEIINWYVENDCIERHEFFDENRGTYDVFAGKAINKLKEYEDLEEQNRLLKLPCAVGIRFIRFILMKTIRLSKNQK